MGKKLIKYIFITVLSCLTLNLCYSDAFTDQFKFKRVKKQKDIKVIEYSICSIPNSNGLMENVVFEKQVKCFICNSKMWMKKVDSHYFYYCDGGHWSLDKF